MLSDLLLEAAAGSGGISDILVDVSENLTLMRASNLIALAIQSTGIVVLAMLLYIVFEALIGPWLMIKGISAGAEERQPLAAAQA